MQNSAWVSYPQAATAAFNGSTNDMIRKGHNFKPFLSMHSILRAGAWLRRQLLLFPPNRGWAKAQNLIPEGMAPRCMTS